MKQVMITIGYTILFLLLIFGGTSFAEEKLKYPDDSMTAAEKIEFCYIAQEKLRLEHNVKGKDFIDGKITKKQWEDYKKDRFELKHQVIINDLLIQRQLLLNSTKYVVDLNDLEKAVIP